MSAEKCGPWEGGLNRYVPQATFGPACALHDEHYQTGSVSRSEADRLFLDAMLDLSTSWWHKPLAFIYYAAVRLGGGRWYRG